MKQNPEISVIFPLPDHRGYFDEILESWISGQTLDAEQYEFLLVSGPADAEMLEALRPRLRDHDEAWVEEDDGILFLMDCAARRARGNILLLTESHCFAHPECLENLNRHFADGSVSLAQCFHINILETRYAEMEQRLEGVMIGCPEEPYWNYVRKRGFAIRQDLYLSMGGFEHEFGYFAERAFAYRLFKNGQRSEFFREAVVYHYNTPGLEKMRPHHEDYAEGMCLYRETLSSHEAEEAFGRFSLWDEREWYRFRSRMTALRAVFGSWFRQGPANVGMWLEFGVRCLKTIELERMMNEIRTAFASWMTACFPGSEGCAYRSYRAYWRGIVKRVHLRTIQDDLDASQSRGDRIAGGGFKWTARTVTDLPHWGFHGLETHEGKEFRWTEPIAFLRIPKTASSTVELILRLHPASPAPEVSGFDLCSKGRGILKTGSWNEEGRTWRGRFEAEGEILLTFVCWKSRRFPGDERRLGIAVESIQLNAPE